MLPATQRSQRPTTATISKFLTLNLSSQLTAQLWQSERTFCCMFPSLASYSLVLASTRPQSTSQFCGRSAVLLTFELCEGLWSLVSNLRRTSWLAGKSLWLSSAKRSCYLAPWTKLRLMRWASLDNSRIWDCTLRCSTMNRSCVAWQQLLRLWFRLASRPRAVLRHRYLRLTSLDSLSSRIAKCCTPTLMLENFKLTSSYLRQAESQFCMWKSDLAFFIINSYEKSLWWYGIYSARTDSSLVV